MAYLTSFGLVTRFLWHPARAANSQVCWRHSFSLVIYLARSAQRTLQNTYESMLIRTHVMTTVLKTFSNIIFLQTTRSPGHIFSLCKTGHCLTTHYVSRRLGRAAGRQAAASSLESMWARSEVGHPFSLTFDVYLSKCVEIRTYVHLVLQQIQISKKNNIPNKRNLGEVEKKIAWGKN